MAGVHHPMTGSRNADGKRDQGMTLALPVGATIVAAFLMYVWFASDGFDVTSWIAAVLQGFVVLSAAAFALGLWISYAAKRAELWRQRNKRQPEAPDGRAATVDSVRPAQARLEFAKWVSFVAAVLLGLPFVFGVYDAISPEQCQSGYECGFGRALLWLFLFSVAGVGVLAAAISWLVYFASRPRGEGKVSGLWTQALIADGLLLCAWIAIQVPAMRVLALLAGLAYLGRRLLKGDAGSAEAIRERDGIA